MAWYRPWRLRLRALFHPTRVDEELDRELDFHLEQEVAERIRRGQSEPDARQDVQRAFGNMINIREDCRRARGLAWWDAFRQDAAYALRALSRTPGFAVAAASLALAAGASAAVLGTVDWLLNRPPIGVHEPDRLVTLQLTESSRPESDLLLGFNFTQLNLLNGMQDVFVDLSAYGKVSGVIANDTTSDEVVFEFTTGNYFQLLGMHPEVGRFYGPDDDAKGRPSVVVLSHAFWQSRFGGDTAVIGRTVRLNGLDCRIVAVTPPDFDGYQTDWNGLTSVWMPVNTAEAILRRDIRGDLQPFIRVMGRLLPNTSLLHVAQRTTTWAKALPRPTRTPFTLDTIVATPSSDLRIRNRAQAASFFSVLTIVSILVLLAACFNVTNFLLGRAMRRRGELAMRASLGASRGAILRLLLTEAVLLGVLAAGLACAVSAWIGWMISTLPLVYLDLPTLTTPISTNQAIGPRMVALASGLGLMLAVLFGLLPAVLGSFRTPLSDLRTVRPLWTWCGLRITVRQGVLALQVSLAVVLAVTAGLYGTSFIRMSAIQTGYADPAHVLVAKIVATGVAPAARQVFYTNLLTRLNGAPGVEGASIGWNLPFVIGVTAVAVPGDTGRKVTASVSAAAPRFFEVHGLRIMAGREFTDSPSDTDEGLVVNPVLARQLWPDTDPIGQEVLYGDEQRRVIGVVADNRCQDFVGDDTPCAWRPFPFNAASGYVRIRTVGDPLAMLPILRSTVRSLNPDVAVANSHVLDALFRERSARQRAAAFASAGLALFGVLLLAFGCVTLFVSMVRDSEREIAIRIALGASHLGLVGRILLQGAVVTVSGAVVGTLVAILISRQVADELYKTEPRDPIAFVAMPLLVLLVGLSCATYAGLIATRSDPARHLHAE